MSIEVERLVDGRAEEWNGYVDRAPGGSPFHRHEALSWLATRTSARVHRLVGYNGQEPIAVFPVFETRSLGRTLVVSPPPMLESVPLGPAFLEFGETKRRKVERYRTEFVEACDEWLDAHLDPAYVHVRGGTELTDVRPFRWADYDATPFYTYGVDLTPDREEILARFSSDARSNVRSEGDATIREGDADDVERIVAQVARRHREQDEPYPLSPGAVRDLYERLPDGRIRPYVCAVDGRMVCGMVTVDDGETVHRWQGGVKYGGDLPAADLLDWHIMREAKAAGRTRYDLVGANMPRLCRYKAKFGPEPLVYFNIKRRSGLREFVSGAQALADDLSERASDLIGE